MRIGCADLQLSAAVDTRFIDPAWVKGLVDLGRLYDLESNPLPPEHKTGVRATTSPHPLVNTKEEITLTKFFLNEVQSPAISHLSQLQATLYFKTLKHIVLELL
jgi:hypothetical protein